jgi:hypothetical protein
VLKVDGVGGVNVERKVLLEVSKMLSSADAGPLEL